MTGTCGKITYESEGAAKHARRYIDTSRKLNVYYCKGCGGWHIGGVQRHHPRRKKRWDRNTDIGGNG